MARLVPDIYSARTGFEHLGRAHDEVESAEAAVWSAREKLKAAEQTLARKRKAFDDIRKATLEHCPALETGYQQAGLTETVAIVDGKVTVVPISSVQRATAEAGDTEAAG